MLDIHLSADIYGVGTGLFSKIWLYNFFFSSSFFKILLAISVNCLSSPHHSFDGDTFFQELATEWKETNRIDIKAAENHAYDFNNNY